MEILIVDDHQIARMGFVALLGDIEPNVRIHEADNAERAIELCRECSPDIALVDLSLNGKFSFDLIKIMNKLCPRAKILVVSMHDERLYAERVLRAGASGYVMKSQAAELILHAVRAIRDGQIWLSQDMRSKALQKFAGRPGQEETDRIASLSDCELQVFTLIGKGKKKSEIEEELQMAPSTVQSHREGIKRKLGFQSGVHLTRAAVTFVNQQNGADGVS